MSTPSSRLQLQSERMYRPSKLPIQSTPTQKTRPTPSKIPSPLSSPVLRNITPSKATPTSQPSVKMDGNNIKVVARFRPENNNEARRGGTTLLDNSDEVTVSINNETFTFDRVFQPDASQADIFNFSITQTVDDFFNGYNGTVLAYGQTGSGKSYTMMGTDINDPKTKGVIPRITDLVFDKIRDGDVNTEFTLSVSYVEIYMEQIRDLLINPKSRPVNLKIHEDPINGIHVRSLAKVYIASPDDLYEALSRGSEMRKTASTEMNEESSRSHAIVQLNLTQENPEGSNIRSKLFLVDLAGSEKVGKTGVTGQALEEAKIINKSLSALGNVINSLTAPKKMHVPYRDSQLTRILQESLGGNSRTSLIINCSPSSYNEAETLSTLRFGTRAKKIKNKAHINSEPSKQDLLCQIEQLKKSNEEHQLREIELESQLEQYRSGFNSTNITVSAQSDEPQELQLNAAEKKSLDYLQNKVLQLTGLLTQVPNIAAPNYQSNVSLSQQMEESQLVNRALMMDLEDKCIKIINMEQVIDDLELRLKRSNETADNEKIANSKVVALERTLEQFSMSMQETELENDRLRKELIKTKIITESKDKVIQELETMVQAQTSHSNYSSTLTTLKTRFSSLKNYTTSPASENSLTSSNGHSDNQVFGIDEHADRSYKSWTSHSSGDYSFPGNSRKSSYGSHSSSGPGKLGLNLNIMRPMRGGPTVIDEC